jgi:hypothetical protein
LDAPRDAASITFLSVLNINSNNYLFFHLNNVIFIFSNTFWKSNIQTNDMC